jgi:hypothetical protein
MAFHHCTVYLADGTVLAKDVQVALEETAREGGPEWYGTMTVTHLAPLEAGQKYRLVLDDGRAGEFGVRRNTFAGGVTRAVSIQGAGPLLRA